MHNRWPQWGGEGGRGRGIHVKLYCLITATIVAKPRGTYTTDIWFPALWAKPTVKKPSTTLAVIDIAYDYQLSVLYRMLLHQGNIREVLVAFLWLICKLGWFATMYCMWNETAQKKFSYKSYYQGAHQNLRYGCIVCDNFQKASKTMQFHKEIDHKN